MIGMMTQVGNNIQGTFYVVWLNEQANISGTLIGTLIAISSAGAIVGSLIAAPLRRYFRPYWLLWFVILVATVLIAIVMAAYTASRAAHGLVTRPANNTLDLTALFLAYAGGQGLAGTLVPRLLGAG